MAFARGASGKGTAGVADDIGVSPDAKEYSSFASAVDVTVDAATGEPRAVRGFMVTDVGTGTLEVVTAAGQTRAFVATNLLGQFIPLSIKTITTNSNIGRIIVFW